MKVPKTGHVVRGMPCPESGCESKAIAVVEDRSVYKCANGHRWKRDRDLEEE